MPFAWQSVVAPQFRRMRCGFFLLLLLADLAPATSGPPAPWGFWGHRQINRMAVFCLPESELFGFYKQHIDWLAEHAVDADKRRFATREEAARHYIDIDRYGAWPFPDLPRDLDSAVAVWSIDTLEAYGMGPWNVERVMALLRWAFRERKMEAVLRYSADLGHYLADLHVPLHCTLNYNGRRTGQEGIHAFWESRLPELFGEGYDYFAGRARYLPDPSAEVWSVVLGSSAAVDSVLEIERALRGELGSDRLYAWEPRGESVLRQPSLEWSEAYHEALSGMVERRMRLAIRNVASFWLTAWMDAGRPALIDPDVLPATDTAVERAWLRGRILGREHGH